MLPFHVLCVYNLIVLHVTINNYLGGFCPSSGAFVRGAFVRGDFVQGDFVRSPRDHGQVLYLLLHACALRRETPIQYPF